MFALYEAMQGIRDFIAAGGPVLYAVAGLTFVMWTLVFERVWYFRFGLPADVGAMLCAWEARPERRSWPRTRCAARCCRGWACASAATSR